MSSATFARISQNPSIAETQRSKIYENFIMLATEFLVNAIGESDGVRIAGRRRRSPLRRRARQAVAELRRGGVPMWKFSPRAGYLCEN